MKPHIKFVGGNWICYGKGFYGPRSASPEKAFHGWKRRLWTSDRDWLRL